LDNVDVNENENENGERKISGKFVVKLFDDYPKLGLLRAERPNPLLQRESERRA